MWCLSNSVLFCRLTPREFNSYGSRRGNDAVMARGTFANIRLVNKFIGKAGPKTIHIPSGETVSEFTGKCSTKFGRLLFRFLYKFIAISFYYWYVYISCI